MQQIFGDKWKKQTFIDLEQQIEKNCSYYSTARHGVNSILELEVMSNSKIPYLKNGNLQLEFAKTKLNPQINLSFNFLIEKYIFHNNSTWNINYSEYILRVGTHGKKW